MCGVLSSTEIVFVLQGHISLLEVMELLLQLYRGGGRFIRIHGEEQYSVNYCR